MTIRAVATALSSRLSEDGVIESAKKGSPHLHINGLRNSAACPGDSHQVIAAPELTKPCL